MHEFYHSVDLGIALYRPTYDKKSLGNNIKYIGLTSGKFAPYLSNGNPVIVNEIDFMSDYELTFKIGHGFLIFIEISVTFCIIRNIIYKNFPDLITAQ
jgi:hypothetical protein